MRYRYRTNIKQKQVHIEHHNESVHVGSSHSYDYYPSESVTRYGLRDHLDEICREKPEFETLRDALGVDQREWASITRAAQLNMPNLSDHDDSHSANIISYIEQMLGEDQIRALSPTDTWMILSAAYSHDIGMYLSGKDLITIWESSDFLDYLVERMSIGNQEARERIQKFVKQDYSALKPIKELLSEVSSSELGYAGILDTATEMHMLLSDYRRRFHGEVSMKMIEDGIDNRDTKFGIQNRLYRIIGKCAYGHSVDPTEIHDLLPSITNGYHFDYAHPRFVAMLLRMGDLLDIDNDRFKDHVIETLPKNNRESRLHRYKHACTSHILVSPTTIEVESDLTSLAQMLKSKHHSLSGDPGGAVFDNSWREDVLDTLKLTNEWFTMIEKELEYWMRYGEEFLPDGLFARIPILNKRLIIIDGSTTEKKDIEENFKIDYQRAFDIIGGENFYSSGGGLAFIREYVQNSFDAVKFQILHDENYNKIKEERNIQSLFNKSLGLLEGMFVELDIIKVNTQDPNKYRIVFIFKDSGEGLSKNSYERLQSVGKRSQRLKEKGAMLGWLRTTGEFGIGVHSAFAFTDRIRYRSFNSDLGSRYQLQLDSQKIRSGSVIRIPDSICDDPSPRKNCGTDVWFSVNGELLISRLFCENSFAQQITVSTHILFEKLLDSVKGMLAQNIIPLDIYLGEIDVNSLGSIDELLNIRNNSECSFIHERIGSVFNLPCPCEKLNSDEEPSVVGDCVVYKTRGECSYNVLYINPAAPNDISDRNLLLRFYKSTTTARGIAFKGAWIGTEANTEINELFINNLFVDIHILGRRACDTINSQRENILPSKVSSIYKDVRRTLYHFIVFLSENLEKAEEFALGNERIASALIMYANCLLYERAGLPSEDLRFKELINIEKICMLKERLSNIIEVIPAGVSCYSLDGSTATKVDYIDGFRALLDDPTKAYYLMSDRMQMTEENVKESTLDKEKEQYLWNFRIDKYDPCLAIDGLDMLYVKEYGKPEDPSDNYVPVVSLTENVDVKYVRATPEAVKLLLRKWLEEEYLRLSGSVYYEYHAYIPAIEPYAELAVDEYDDHTAKNWRLCRRFIRMPQPKKEDSLIKDGKLSSEYFDACRALAERLANYCVERKTSKKDDDVKKAADKYIELIDYLCAIYMK